MSVPPPVPPWYRQKWPWLLMLMPALAVVGGFITLWFAMSTNNALVVDDYYKDGKAINLELGRDRVAEQRGLQATLSRAAPGVSLQLVALNGSLPPFVTLRLVHATRAELDQTITLSAAGSGLYRAQAPELPATGRWNLLLEDPDRSWRLTATADSGFAEPLKLGGQP